MLEKKIKRRKNETDLELKELNEINKMNIEESYEETLLDKLLKSDIPNIKPRVKVVEQKDFIVPDIYKYDNILNLNYNLKQLKYISKYYKLKSTGNKEILKKRIYNYFFYSLLIIIIQKNIRRFLTKIYINLHGPAFYKREMCINDVDFCSLDSIKAIPYNQFFSYKDINNFIYGFDIQSLYNLYFKNKNIDNNNIENPFNKILIPNEVYLNILKYIKFSNLLKISININFNDSVDEMKKLDMKIINLFIIMDSLGNYTNISWFSNLNKQELIRFIRELYDIWVYRANIAEDIKRNICFPSGDPFRVMNIRLNNLSNYNTNIIKKNIVSVLEELITKGVNEDSKKLGVFYILSSLTLVSSEAAENMPWLYESVIY